MHRRQRQPCKVPKTSDQHDEQPRTPQHQAEIRNVEEQLREKERYLQIREAEIQKMLQAVDERREAVNPEEGSLQQRLAAVREQEEKLRLREAALTQRMPNERQRNRPARDSDRISLASTIRNSKHDNMDFFFKNNASLKEESEYYTNEG